MSNMHIHIVACICILETFVLLHTFELPPIVMMRTTFKPPVWFGLVWFIYVRVSTIPVNRARSSLVVTHPSTSRGRRALTSVNVPLSSRDTSASTCDLVQSGTCCGDDWNITLGSTHSTVIGRCDFPWYGLHTSACEIDRCGYGHRAIKSLTNIHILTDCYSFLQTQSMVAIIKPSPGGEMHISRYAFTYEWRVV